MEWLLVIFLMSPPDDIEFEEVRFATKAECLAAAEAFVERYPFVELRDRSGETAVETPLLRSYVECVQAPPE